MTKGVECTFGFLKGKMLYFKIWATFSEYTKMRSDVVNTSCIGQFLHDIDGLDKYYENEPPSS